MATASERTLHREADRPGRAVQENGRATRTGRSLTRTVLLHSQGDAPRERARWRVRLAAYRIAADCEHLLDELTRAGTSSETDAIGRALLAARAVIALTADPTAAGQ